MQQLLADVFQHWCWWMTIDFIHKFKTLLYTWPHGKERVETAFFLSLIKSLCSSKQLLGIITNLPVHGSPAESGFSFSCQENGKGSYGFQGLLSFWAQCLKFVVFLCDVNQIVCLWDSFELRAST